MKPTPTERQALAKARTIQPMELEEAQAVAGLPDLRTFAHRVDRLRLAQTRLAWTAEEWERRQLRLALYQTALRKGDRSEIHDRRVTALDTPTKGIRRKLIDDFRALAKAETALFTLF